MPPPPPHTLRHNRQVTLTRDGTDTVRRGGGGGGPGACAGRKSGRCREEEWGRGLEEEGVVCSTVGSVLVVTWCTFSLLRSVQWTRRSLQLQDRVKMAKLTERVVEGEGKEDEEGRGEPGRVRGWSVAGWVVCGLRGRWEGVAPL